MSSKVVQDLKSHDANTPPKKLTNAEALQKMLADQKLIREELQNGTTFQELREKYGFVFKTV